MKGLIKVELLAKAFHHLRCELGIKGIYLTGLTGSQVDDQKRDHRDKEQGDDLLYDTPAYE